jgi:MFS family permease
MTMIRSHPNLEAVLMSSLNSSPSSHGVDGVGGLGQGVPQALGTAGKPATKNNLSTANGAEKPTLAEDRALNGRNGQSHDRPSAPASVEPTIEPTIAPSNGAGSQSPALESPAIELINAATNGTKPPTSDDLPQNGKNSGNEPKPESGFASVLRNRSFLTLWSGQIFSQLADKVYLVLMIALIENRFQAQGQTISGWVSSIMIAFTIPAVLFGSIAGAYVDRWSKKAVLVSTNLLRGGLVFTLPVLLWLSKGWAPLAGLPLGFCILLGITFLVSTLTQFFAPAEQSAMPLIVERRQLLSANSLYTTTAMASVIIGFAVGEPLLAIADNIAAGFGWTAIGLGKELVVGAGYAIAGLILLLLQTGEARKCDLKDTATTPHVFEDIRDGLRYLRQQPRVRGALMQLVILFSVFAALAVLAVRLAEVMVEIKSSQFGFLMAAGGVGMAIGAALLGHYGHRIPHSRLSLVGSLGMATALFGLAFFCTQLVPALLLLALVGGFAAIVGVPMQTAIQEETPEAMRGKVFGLQNNAINIALSLPLALAGVAEAFLGLRIVFIGLAAIVVIGGVLNWYIADTESIEN